MQLGLDGFFPCWTGRFEFFNLRQKRKSNSSWGGNMKNTLLFLSFHDQHRHPRRHQGFDSSIWMRPWGYRDRGLSGLNPLDFGNSIVLTPGMPFQHPYRFQPWFMISMEGVRAPSWDSFHLGKTGKIEGYEVTLKWIGFIWILQKKWMAIQAQIYPDYLAFTIVSLILGCFFVILERWAQFRLLFDGQRWKTASKT